MILLTCLWYDLITIRDEFVFISYQGTSFRKIIVRFGELVRLLNVELLQSMLVFLHQLRRLLVDLSSLELALKAPNMESTSTSIPSSLVWVT